MSQRRGSLATLAHQVRDGAISRRQFIERAAQLGVGFAASGLILNSLLPYAANAQSASPAAGASPVATLTRPEAPADQVRGAGGQLKILQWQAVTHLSPHNANGSKDYDGGTPVYEPLLHLLNDATLWPNLVKEVPTVANGGLAPDLSTVTYHLLEGVLWSDGEPFTANDVVATYNWILDPNNGAVTVASYDSLAKVEAIDDLTVKLTFKSPTLGWYLPFTSNEQGVIYPKHILDQGDAANDIIRTAPIGTGPYKVDSFTENDQVTYSINDNYREANKPYFATINLKGGGDPSTAAQAVLQTAEWDLAENLQVEPDILENYASSGKGQLVHTTGSGVEYLFINFSDPNKEVNGQRSEVNTPHPFFTDPAVRQALSLATDRETISKQLYFGPPAEPPAVNAITGIPAYESPNTTWEFNLDKANQVLDAAGWALDGDVRKKGDIELSLTYNTTINSIRQKAQAINKANWEKVGFKVTLDQVDSGIFFDVSAGNEQNDAHFYYDLLQYTDGPSTPFPVDLAHYWYAGPNDENVAQASNTWTGTNKQRWVNPDYDKIYESLLVETDPEKAAEQFIALNDLVVDNFVVIPIVARGGSYGVSNRLDVNAIQASAWEPLYWNIANWTEAQQ